MRVCARVRARGAHVVRAQLLDAEAGARADGDGGREARHAGADVHHPAPREVQRPRHRQEPVPRPHLRRPAGGKWARARQLGMGDWEWATRKGRPRRGDSEGATRKGKRARFERAHMHAHSHTQPGPRQLQTASGAPAAAARCVARRRRSIVWFVGTGRWRGLPTMPVRPAKPPGDRPARVLARAMGGARLESTRARLRARTAQRGESVAPSGARRLRRSVARRPPRRTAWATGQ